MMGQQPQTSQDRTTGDQGAEGVAEPPTGHDVLNEIAWRDFVLFAWSQEDAHAAFRGATNRPQRSKNNSPIDAMIDRAVGGSEDDQYMTEFVDWVTKTQWGEDYAPEAWKRRRNTHQPGITGCD